MLSAPETMFVYMTNSVINQGAGGRAIYSALKEKRKYRHDAQDNLSYYEKLRASHTLNLRELLSESEADRSD